MSGWLFFGKKSLYVFDLIKKVYEDDKTSKAGVNIFRQESWIKWHLLTLKWQVKKGRLRRGQITIFKLILMLLRFKNIKMYRRPGGLNADGADHSLKTTGDNDNKMDVLHIYIYMCIFMYVYIYICTSHRDASFFSVSTLRSFRTVVPTRACCESGALQGPLNFFAELCLIP